LKSEEDAMSIEVESCAPMAQRTAKGVLVTVTVFKDLSKPDKVRFEMKSHWKIGKDRLGFDKTKDKLKKNAIYQVNFELDDPDDTGLVFAPDKDDAMWVSQGLKGSDPTCPNNACHNKTAFEAISVTDYLLSANNPNDTIERIAFTLRFLKPGADPKNPNSYVPYDPIIENQDGGV
jgi:hypothetical protein